jgi:hypothetical protein
MTSLSLLPPSADAHASPAAQASRLPFPVSSVQRLNAHPLVGKTLRLRETLEEFLVEEVYEGWWKGHYRLVSVAARRNDQRHTWVSEALNSLSQDINDEARWFAQQVEVLDSALLGTV